MKTLILLLSILIMAVGYTNASDIKAIDSTAMPDKEHDVFVLLTSTPSSHYEGTGGMIVSVKSEDEQREWMDYCLNKGDTILIFTCEFIDNKAVMPRSFLQKIKPIDIDKVLSSLQEFNVMEMCEKLKGKRIWVIDRNDMTDKTITLTETDAVINVVLDRFGIQSRE